MGVSHGGETCTWVGCVYTTYEKGGSDSKGTGPRDRLGDGDLYETCRVNLPVPYHISLSRVASGGGLDSPYPP